MAGCDAPNSTPISSADTLGEQHAAKMFSLMHHTSARVESGEANVQMLLPVVHQPWSFSFPKFSSSRFHPLSYLFPVFPLCSLCPLCDALFDYAQSRFAPSREKSCCFDWLLSNGDKRQNP